MPQLETNLSAEKSSHVRGNHGDASERHTFSFFFLFSLLLAWLTLAGCVYRTSKWSTVLTLKHPITASYSKAGNGNDSVLLRFAWNLQSRRRVKEANWSCRSSAPQTDGTDGQRDGRAGGQADNHLNSSFWSNRKCFPHTVRFHFTSLVFQCFLVKTICHQGKVEKDIWGTCCVFCALQIAFQCDPTGCWGSTRFWFYPFKGLFQVLLLLIHHRGPGSSSVCWVWASVLLWTETILVGHTSHLWKFCVNSLRVSPLHLHMLGTYCSKIISEIVRLFFLLHCSDEITSFPGNKKEEKSD